MEGCYNLRNPAVKRIMREAEELRNATEEYYAHPVEENLFEWHFTVRGPPKTDFDGGIYHGRITLPPDYPMKPPSIILLTPNGRFEVNKKICLSISGHHPESWQPSWSIRTALLAIIGFMPTHGNGAIGSLDYSPEERQKLAESSRKWKCPECGSIENLLRKEVLGADPTALSESQRMALFLPIKSHMEMDESRISNCAVSNCNETTPINELEPLSRNEASESMKFLNIAIGKNHSVSVNETSSGSSSRQRSVASLNSLPAATLPERPVDIRRSLQEVFTATYITVCMWLIVILIGTLLLRRLFFSYY